MLIDYAINYYCWPELQAFVLLRMYGCGCMDTVLNAVLLLILFLLLLFLETRVYIYVHKIL